MKTTWRSRLVSRQPNRDLIQTIPAQLSSVPVARPQVFGLAIPPSEDLTTYWHDEISACHDRGKAHTVELCRLVSSARRALKHGEWTGLWRLKEAPFSKSKADKLAGIGSWLRCLNAHTCEHLPAGWRILRILSRLDARTTCSLVSTGEIHSKLTLDESEQLVVAILPQHPPCARSSRIAKLIA